MSEPHDLVLFAHLARKPDSELDLERAALLVAETEYPGLDVASYVAKLDGLGQLARQRLKSLGLDPSAAGFVPAEGMNAVLRLLYQELGFRGNVSDYYDPRNSFLNDVIDRRTGIPITLAVVYLEVARRAGVQVTGVNFPGHFLLRAADERARMHYSGDFVIVDPFHGGALLSELDCREMLRQHVGDEAAFDTGLLQPATRHEIVVRMLVNLKRLYVRMRSFPQARFVADLLLTVDPTAVSELRDRGLLAYHLQDFGAALRDLENYLQLLPRQVDEPEPSTMTAEIGDETTEEEVADESTQIWEHIKNLRKRVAGFN